MATTSADRDILSGEAKNLFTSAMHEEGLEPDAVDVHHWKDTFSDSVLFIAAKEINGEMRKVQLSLNISPDRLDTQTVQQEIAMAARNAVKAFEEEMYEYLDISGTRLVFCSCDGGWVECKQCKNKITLSDLVSGPFTSFSAGEFSHPSPTPYDIQNFLQRLSSAEKEVLRLYLLGALRRQCRCEFGL